MQQQGEVTREVAGVPSTMLVTLATRALAPIDRPDIGFRDAASERIIQGLGVDPRALCRKPNMLLGTVCRAMFADRVARDFFRRHPDGLGVNLACGLSTNYDRLADAGVVPREWIDLDLPEVIAIRRRFFTDTGPRRMDIGDATDATLFDRLLRTAGGRPTLFVVEGLLFYLEAAQAEAFFRRLAAAADATRTPVEILFDYMAPAGLRAFNRFNFDITDRGAVATWALRRADDLRAWDARLEIVEVYDYISRLSPMPRVVNAVHRVLRGGPMIGNVHARRHAAGR